MNPQDIRARKGGMPLVCLTAYTASVAALLDPHCDIILVGDSVGMTVYGMDTTQGVTLDMMIRHGAAARKGCQNALLVVDMPYGTYESSPDQALETARRIMDETRCDAVKLEGGAAMAPAIARLSENGIPVMAHIGMTPQSYASGDPYKVQGKTDSDVARLLDDGRAVEAAGAFSVVIECTVADAAGQITRAVAIPTIGIGASPACDGQILVVDDMLGITARPPKFVKTYADLKSSIADAAKNYADDVRARRFPDSAHTYAAATTTKLYGNKGN